MFRCAHCGSGYSSRAAASWSHCPRCMARDRVSVPLTFEVGWQDRRAGAAEKESARAERPKETSDQGGG